VTKGMMVLTGRANRWLKLLEDFGHLTPEGMDRLYVGIAELALQSGHPPDQPVDLPLARRAAALLLAPEGDEPLPPILDEDWPLLFS
jgi:hypothetical protein